MGAKTKQATADTPVNAGSARELLLQAAKKVFAEKGFDGATVKDLAAAAGVNVSLVSYHFNGKEGLYRSCIEGFGQQNFTAVEMLLKPARNHSEFRLRLKMFAEHFIGVSHSEPEICRIIHRDFEFADLSQSQLAKIVYEVFERSFLPMYRHLVTFVKSAQKDQILRSDINCEIAATMILGSLMQMVRMEEKRKFMLGSELLSKKNLDQTISQYLDVITAGVFMEAKL